MPTSTRRTERGSPASRAKLSAVSPDRFLSPAPTSLKICGVTLADDAMRLAELGVEALGANFWPHSKRYLAPERAGFLKELEGRILRVGVFVNPDLKLPARLVPARIGGPR